MKVVFIRAGRSRGYISVGIDTGGAVKSFTVSEKDYFDAGSPRSSDILDEQALGAIEASDMRYRATVKALHILSFGDNSTRTLIRKLQESGITHECACETAREMLRLGYIDERRQITRLILNETRLHFSGPAKLLKKLMAKGYKRSDIEEITDELTESGELDFEDLKKRLIESRLPSDADGDDIKKLLYKNGY